MQDCWIRTPLIDVVPCMHKLTCDTKFPWETWCQTVYEGFGMCMAPLCFIHSPHEVLRLAWAAAFRIPSDDVSNSHFYDEYSDTVVDCIFCTFPFMSAYSAAWFIDRLYRYMGRNDVSVKQLCCDDRCLMNLAPTVSDATVATICTDVVIGNVRAAHMVVSWLRSCMLCDEFGSH